MPDVFQVLKKDHDEVKAMLALPAGLVAGVAGRLRDVVTGRGQFPS